MKLPARSAVWLLPLLLTACFHKNHQGQVERLAPPIEDAPLPKPVPSPTELPPSVITVPHQAPAPDTNPQPQQVPPKPPVRHRKPVANNTQQASSDSPEVSAIGQLSSGDPSDLQQRTLDSIAATERGLNGITRPLSDQELKTAGRIREFLKQARAALASGDVDGAHTLAAKASVLLGELSR
jgi:outer membrane biosynthesis protein TonB